ncbi:MAG TPA: hypothetical protein VMP01_00240 [Pirellulaceae bacterium]|nr:hypothetical protein [Pirellulaceae bacterium]
MKVYLDTCCLNRPLDDRSQPRVNIEAEAVQSILKRCEQGDCQLVNSDTLAFEVAQTASEERRAFLEEELAIAGERVAIESVDDRLLKKCASMPALAFKVGLPQDLIKEWVV